MRIKEFAERAFGIKVKTKELKMQLSLSDCRDLLAVVELGLQDAKEHRDYCNSNGFWAAGSLSWPQRIEMLEELKEHITELEKALA